MQIRTGVTTRRSPPDPRIRGGPYSRRRVVGQSGIAQAVEDAVVFRPGAKIALLDIFVDRREGMEPQECLQRLLRLVDSAELAESGSKMSRTRPEIRGTLDTTAQKGDALLVFATENVGPPHKHVIVGWEGL